MLQAWWLNLLNCYVRGQGCLTNQSITFDSVTLHSPYDPCQCLHLVILEYRSRPKTILGGKLVEIALGLFRKKKNIKDFLSWEAFGVC